MFGFDEFHELVFVFVQEVEDEAGSFLEFDQQALPFGEISTLHDVADFHQGPEFLNGLILGQYEGRKLEMGIFLEGG